MHTLSGARTLALRVVGIPKSSDRRVGFPARGRFHLGAIHVGGYASVPQSNSYSAAPSGGEKGLLRVIFNVVQRFRGVGNAW